ncbi:MAG: HupE/UreJ family protein [Myxococcales bacterium]
MSRWLWILCIALSWPGLARAHNFTMSVLSVTQVGDGQFVTHWKRLEGLKDPNAAYLVLRPEFPEHCVFDAPRLSCGSQGLHGRLGFGGLGNIATSAMMELSWVDAPAESYVFGARESHVLIAASRRERSFGMLARAFTLIGVEHIWFGWDHLLFVLGLLWLVRTPRALLWTITSFTLAHSITLSVATLGYRTLPVPPVEAVIALSIVLLAVEVTRQARGAEPTLTVRAPWLVAFGFGLLHGFGFASALSEIQIAQAELPSALLFFNVGVELGQLSFVALAWALRWAVTRWAPQRARDVLATTAQYAMGSVGMYWFVERVTAFF